MGFVVLALAAGSQTGLQAALFANIPHGVISALLFFLVGGPKPRWGSVAPPVTRPVPRRVGEGAVPLASTDEDIRGVLAREEHIAQQIEIRAVRRVVTLDAAPGDVGREDRAAILRVEAEVQEIGTDVRVEVVVAAADAHHRRDPDGRAHHRARATGIGRPVP